MRARVRGEEGSPDVQSILKWLFRHRLESFSLRDLTRDLSATFSKRALALQEAIDWLIKHDCLRPQATPQTTEKKKRGRPKSATFLVNPHLHASQISQNAGLDSYVESRLDTSSDPDNSATDTAVSEVKEDGYDLPPY